MNQTESDAKVVGAACAEITKGLSQENSNVRYELSFQRYNVRNEVLPIAMKILSEVLYDPEVHSDAHRKYSEGKLGSQETDQVLSNLSPTISTDSNQFTYTSQQSYKSTISNVSDTPLLPNTATHKNQNFNFQSAAELSESKSLASKKSNYINIQKRYLAILAIGALFGTIVLSVLIALVVWKKTGNRDITFMDGLYATCYPAMFIGHLVVKSLDDYNTHARKYPNPETPIAVKITEPSDWPLGVPIEGSKNIFELTVTGPIHGYKLVELLPKAPAMSKLTISNECNHLCSETQQPIVQLNKEILKSPLKIMILKNFQSSCTKLLDILAENMIFNELEELILDSGVLDGNIMKEVENILVNSRNSLKRLEFVNTAASVELFTLEQQSTYSFVSSIVYDIRESLTSSIPKHFCSMFPSLEHLSFGSSLREWADIENIMSCKYLKTISFKLKMPEKQANFSLAFLSSSFPRLESAEITLDFPKCSTPSKFFHKASGNYILDKNMLSDLLLINTGITSNCKLIHL